VRELTFDGTDNPGHERAPSAGSERVDECSLAVVMCAEISGRPTPEPSIGRVAGGSRTRLTRSGQGTEGRSHATLPAFGDTVSVASVDGKESGHAACEG
jgi:hypothetical protein